MSRLVDDFFNEIDTKIPDDVSRLVEKQMDIAEAIAKAIDNSKYSTRKEFAQAIGMKPSMLSRILAGNVNLTLKTITKIESALNIDIIHVHNQSSINEKQYTISVELYPLFFSYPVSEKGSPYRRDRQFPENEHIDTGISGDILGYGVS